MARRTLFLVALGFEPLDPSGLLCAFNAACDLHSAVYEIGVVSAVAGPVFGSAGLSVAADGLAGAGHGDTVIVVGEPVAHLPGRQSATTAMLAEFAPATRHMASVCTGAFYLAEAGVLDSRRATTHWQWAPLLRSRFLHISVEANRIHVADGGG